MRKPKEKMIDEMALRGLSDATQTAYLYAVRRDQWRFLLLLQGP